MPLYGNPDSNMLMDSPAKSDTARYPEWTANAFLAAMVILAAGLGGYLLFTSPPGIDRIGLLVFVMVVLVAEWLSIEIYVKNTTVSTSAAPLLGGSMLLGPLGAIILAAAVAAASFTKRRTPLRHLVFNTSNHLIAGLMAAGFVTLIGKPITDWPMLLQTVASVVVASLVYIVSTGLLAIVIGLSIGQPARPIWAERFRWLGPYYLALGVVAHALIFSYSAAGLVGILVVMVPLMMLRFSEKQYVDNTKEMVRRLRLTNKELAEKAEEITLLNEDLLLTLARSIDLRDPHVMEHSKNVSRYATLVAEEMGLSPERVGQIRKAGLLHDIGKLGIPEAILFKPDRLNEQEYRSVKEHVLVGADLIYGCHSLRGLIPFVKYHHERYDGRGYPEGLAGESIPLEARIVGLADAVEAMASDRPYKEAMTATDVLEEIARCTGSQFDPQVAQAFGRVIQKQGASVIANSARDVELRKERSKERINGSLLST